jgi:hypothetical protein
MIRTEGGSFDPGEEMIYFLADQPGQIQYSRAYHTHFLLAVNYMGGKKAVEELKATLGMGKSVFIDSGVFELAISHARAHDMHMDEALSLPPEEMDGFEELFERYVWICQEFGDQVWGYCELDQGGRENKIRIRTRLEKLGLRPIPVYHMLNDGWEYFDYLAERYDRVCFGNVSQATGITRKRILATAWERHRKYPDCWIHLLGWTPNPDLLGWPINSADSSTWIGGVRWPLGTKENADMARFSALPRGFQYKLGQEQGRGGRRRAVGLASYIGYMLQRNWRGHLGRLREMGGEWYPPIGEKEKGPEVPRDV